MLAKRIEKSTWTHGLRKLTERYRVFVPAIEGAHHQFTRLTDATEPDFDFQNTRLSPKNLIFPQSERMFTFTTNPADPQANILAESPKDFSAQAVIGLRPCDAAALTLVRKNFDTEDYKDPWWTKRYEATTFVGFACDEPSSTCFCTSTGFGPYDETGLDVLMVDQDTHYLLKALTEKGEALLVALDLGEAAPEDALKRIEAAKEAAEKKIASSVTLDKLKGQRTTALFDAPFWKDVAAGCINCGACTYACPTCWCFDIQDEVRKLQGDRLRNWDSCMFPLFTKHGSGHNPREEKYQRVRQRFMHKMKYYMDKYDGGALCVGCGRCVDVCPANIDIRQVATLMNDYQPEEVNR